MSAPTDISKRIEHILWVLMMAGLVWIGIAPAKYSDPTMHVALPLFMIIGLVWSLVRSMVVETPAERHGYYGFAVIWLIMLGGVFWMYANRMMT